MEEALSSIPAGQTLTHEQNDLLLIGCVIQDHDEHTISLTPLHPLNVMYQLMLQSEQKVGDVRDNLVEKLNALYLFLLNFWHNVDKNIVQWNELRRKEISKVDLREHFIVTQAIVIQALGRVGNVFLHHPEYAMEEKLTLLKEVNWRRNAKEWQLRAIKTNGRMISGETAVLLTANVIKRTLGLPLEPDEAAREEKFLKNNQLS